MCNVCCKEFQGWCRAFTATEVILSILQAILLSFLVAFLSFLILHLIVCSDDTNIRTVQPDKHTSETLIPADQPTTHVYTDTHSENVAPEEITSSNVTTEDANIRSTVPPDIACTWTPLAKTSAVTQYFDRVETPIDVTDVHKNQVTVAPPPGGDHTVLYNGGVFNVDQFDGEPAVNERNFIMALVKMRPPDDITFGCVLTIISEFWTLTAASCIESIEEVDSLDSFVMMEDFGEPKHGRTHRVSEVLIHPQYQGVNNTYDIVALKSDDILRSGGESLKLATMLDYLVTAIGERLTILGFGKFRSIDKDAFSRGAHAVSVHVVEASQCSGLQQAWGARHLTRGAPAPAGRCAPTGLCAGPLRARAAPCTYCAGTPLLQARVLLGLMAAPGPCGAPCDPALYVNLAAVRDWLNLVLNDY